VAKKANLRLFLEREGNKKCPLEHMLFAETVNANRALFEINMLTSLGLP